MKAVLPAVARDLVEPHLPDGVDTAWWSTRADAERLISDADIAWVDLAPVSMTAGVIRAAGPKLKWVFTIYAGLDGFPFAFLKDRGAQLTNGVGINSVAVAEYAVLGILAAAKRYDMVVRLQDRQEWPQEAPGRIELFESRALVVGMGAIGRLIGDRLAAFGVEVVGVTRSGRGGTLTTDQWRARLGEFDWVVLAAPSTDATKAMIGGAEFAAMKRSAWLINIARGDMIDEEALLDALETGKIAGAFLDPTDPEPLPAGHRIWSAPNTLISMHLSGRSQTRMYARAAELFLLNLEAFLNGRPMRNAIDLEIGY
jgi:phosphoglycerate dehydrogenase-like enzyme